MRGYRYGSINPVIALLSGTTVLTVGLITAKSVLCSYFLAAVFVWFVVFGLGKVCLRVLPLFVIVGGVFALIAYYASQQVDAAVTMLNRFAAIFWALVPGMSTETVRLTRNLSQLHVPRAVTLGMLIATSFLPLLRLEIKRVREAMKTHGAGSILNPRIFYRAFLVPLVMRLVNISDTLALSVETRGFALKNSTYTVYKKEKVYVADILYLLGIVAASVLLVVL